MGEFSDDAGESNDDLAYPDLDEVELWRVFDESSDDEDFEGF